MARIIIALLGLGIFFGAGVAHAQEIEASTTIDSDQQPIEDKPEAAPRSRLLDEITVTAQKREEDKQDVPVSVQAFTAGTLDAQGIVETLDLPQITPGLSVTEQVAYVTTYIRGIGSDAFLLADPSVAQYYDGIYQPFPNGLSQDFGQIERVEVLKGPQGTLFGRNAVGGAVSVVTTPPNLQDIEAGVQAGYQRYDRYNTRAYLSVPVWEDHIAVGFSAVYNTGDNHIDGTTNGRPLERLKDTGFRLKIRIAPVDWIDFTVTGVRIRNDGPTTTYTPNRSPFALLGATITPQDPRAGAVNEDLSYINENDLYYANLDVSLPWFDVKLLGSYQDVFSSFEYDFDSSPEPLSLFNIESVFSVVRTAEVQFVSSEDSPFSDYLTWIIGGYYFESETGFDPSFLRVASTNLDQGILLGNPIPSDLVDLIKTVTGGLPIPTGDIDTAGALATESVSFFAQATLNVTDWLALTAGLRWQEEERTLLYSTSGLRNQDGSVTFIQEYYAANGDQTEDGRPLIDTTKSTDPKLSVALRPELWGLTENLLIYASWQKATKSSTYNVFNIYDAPDYVAPEEMTAYEVGLKTSLLDGLLNIEGAWFDYEVEDQQVQFISLLAGGAVQFENAGTVTVSGIELGITASIWPSLFDGWGDLVFTFGGVYLDAIYSSYPNGSGFTEQGLLTQNNDFSGNDVVRTPEWNGNIGLLQSIFTNFGTFEIGANYYYNSGFYFSAQNIDVASQGDYRILNARISYFNETYNARLTVFGNNVLNEDYSYSNFIADFGVGDAKAPLAVYGLRLELKY